MVKIATTSIMLKKLKGNRSPSFCKFPDSTTKTTSIRHAQGDTKLHSLIRSSKNFSEIKESISQFSEPDLASMATATNNQGMLPIHFMNEEMDLEEKTKINAVMLPFMLKHNLKDIHEPIHFQKEVVDPYHPEPGSELYRNLEIASLVANKTRQTIEASSTHPQINHWPTEEKTLLHHYVLAVRNDIRKALKPIVSAYTIDDKTQYDYASMTFHIHPSQLDLPDKIGKQLLEVETTLLEKRKIANCDEFAHMGLKYLIEESNEKIPGTICKITHGDHCVLLVGKNKQDAAISDLWAGQVFPYSVLRKKLRAYLNYHYYEYYRDEWRDYNILTAFNSNYHQFEPILSYKLKPSQQTTLSLFKPSHHTNKKMDKTTSENEITREDYYKLVC